MTTKAFQIENLDVYRKAVALGTRIYSFKSGHQSSVLGLMREKSLSMVLNLASGLGFWEKEWKIKYLRATKQALVEFHPLMEIAVALGDMGQSQMEEFDEQIKDITKSVNGLIRSAMRREE